MISLDHVIPYDPTTQARRSQGREAVTRFRRLPASPDGGYHRNDFDNVLAGVPTVQGDISPGAVYCESETPPSVNLDGLPTDAPHGIEAQMARVKHAGEKMVSGNALSECASDDDLDVAEFPECGLQERRSPFRDDHTSPRQRKQPNRHSPAGGSPISFLPAAGSTEDQPIMTGNGETSPGFDQTIPVGLHWPTLSTDAELPIPEDMAEKRKETHFESSTDKSLLLVGIDERQSSENRRSPSTSRASSHYVARSTASPESDLHRQSHGVPRTSPEAGAMVHQADTITERRSPDKKDVQHDAAGHSTPVRERSESTSAAETDDEGQCFDEAVWSYSSIIDYRTDHEGRVLVKVVWDPSWEDLRQLEGGEKALAQFKRRQQRRDPKRDGPRRNCLKQRKLAQRKKSGR